MGKERREREALTDGEWDILRAIVQTRLRRPYRLIVFDDTDVCRKYLADNYPLKSYEYASINAVPEKNYRKTRLVESGLNAQGGSFSMHEGDDGIYTADHLVLDGTQDDYVTELVKRRFLRKESANKNDDYRSYTVSLDGERSIKDHSGRGGKLNKPFADPALFADIADMLGVDRNICHRLDLYAVIPDFVDTEVCDTVVGWEFPQYPGVVEGEWVPYVSYYLQFPKQAVDVGALGSPGDPQPREVTWYHQPYLLDVETGPAVEWLLYWRRQGEFIHFWFGEDYAADTDMATLIESRLYPQGELVLPNSVVYRGQIKQYRRDSNRERYKPRVYGRHPCIRRLMRVWSCLFGDRLPNWWLDRQIKQHYSYEPYLVDWGAQQLRQVNENQPSTDTSPLPGEDSTATRTE